MLDVAKAGARNPATSPGGVICWGDEGCQLAGKQRPRVPTHSELAPFVSQGKEDMTSSIK